MLHSPKFFSILLRIDIDLAERLQAKGCPCGGILHRADYPRKPRACPSEARSDFAWRFSFCCNVCRKRSTAMSVRFLGRRVYLALAVVLVSAPRANPMAAATQLCASLAIPVRTAARWRTWWTEMFPVTPLWQASCARFMPPPAAADFPASLVARFTGPAADAMACFLVFLTPLTVRQ